MPLDPAVVAARIKVRIARMQVEAARLTIELTREQTRAHARDELAILIAKAMLAAAEDPAIVSRAAQRQTEITRELTREQRQARDAQAIRLAQEIWRRSQRW